MKKVAFVVLAVVALSFALAGCKKSGEALWKDACDKMTQAMMDEGLKDLPKEALAEAKKKAESEEGKKMMEEGLKKCVAEFGKADAAAADETAACIVDAKDLAAMQKCGEKMEKKKEGEEKKEEKPAE